MTLLRLLPVMVGHLVDRDDNHWHCFLLLWDIADIATAFEISESETTHLVSSHVH